jgi:hypothetical protein
MVMLNDTTNPLLLSPLTLGVFVLFSGLVQEASVELSMLCSPGCIREREPRGGKSCIEAFYLLKKDKREPSSRGISVHLTLLCSGSVKNLALSC